MRTIRWQLILLGLGLLLVLGTGIYLLVRPAPGRDEVTVAIAEDEARFSEAIVGEPALINPLLATSQADRDLVALIFSGLTTVDEFGQPIPDLAESWDVSADGLTYTFTLRQDVRWHDGQPFTARDVAFTMSLLRDPRFPGPANLGTFWRTVETYAEDDYTVRFLLTQPLTAFPEYAGIGLLPAHLLEGIDSATLADQPFNLAPIGTGPLRLESITQEGGVAVVRLRPHQTAPLTATPFGFDELELRFYPNHRTAFAALGRDVLAMGDLTASELGAALASPRLNVYTAPLPVYAAVIFNQQAPERLPFFQEEDVRVALAMAIDRRALIEGALGRQALLAETPILPGTWAYAPDVQMPPYDPAAAAQLLDEAGWAIGEGNMRQQGESRLTFTLLVSNQSTDQQLGQAMAQAWQAIGVDVEVRAVPPTTFQTEVFQSDPESRTFDAALIEFSQGGLADPDPYPFWHQSQIQGGQNYSGFSDRQISEVLEIARKDPNGVRRAELYRDFQRGFSEATAAILLYYPTYHYTVSCQVTGVQLVLPRGPSDRFRTLASWRLASPDELDAVCSSP